MKKIQTDLNKCVACKSCEMACAIEHTGLKTVYAAVLDPDHFQTRIRVEKVDAFSLPVRCQHCDDAPCILACPTGAMSRLGYDDPVLVKEERCIGCFMCSMVCPFGAITVTKGTPKALKCDFCPDRSERGLDPSCVSACPTKALSLVSVEDDSKQKRALYAKQYASGVEPISDPLIQLWRTGRQIQYKERL